MSDRLPSISGKSLIRFLESEGYDIVRQRGSHVRMEKMTHVGRHKITIPVHNPVAKGTLADIIGKVSIWCQIEKKEMISKLRLY